MRIAAVLVALLTVAQAPSPPLDGARVVNGHFKAGGPRYEYLPFDLSAGTESVTISYSYSGDDGASVIDLGLFEPGPLTLGTPAFRGYSGGAQRTITVGRNQASPGYKTGPLPAGQWHVLLGMYKVAPGGVDVQIKISETREEVVPQMAARPEGRALPITNESPRWYSGGLHLHTNHSDGAFTPAAVSDAARAAGLDFIVITDHNTTTHQREPMPASPLHIIGEEVTTPAGHASVLGLPEGAWIDFRVTADAPHAADEVGDLVAQAHRAGALFGISHPVDNCAGCSWQQAIPAEVDAIEIWQNEKGPRESEVAFWDRLLRSGRRVTALGVSDWHRPPARLDTGAVRVFAGSLTKPAILDGIRQGRVIVMHDGRTRPPSVRARCGSAEAGVGGSLSCVADEDLSVRVSMPDLPGSDAEFSWNAARMTIRAIGRGTTFTMPAAAGYLRVRVYAADGSTVAITNPVYVSLR